MEQEHPLAFGGDPQFAVNDMPTRPDGMKPQADAVRKILSALEPLPSEGRARVIRAVAALFGVGLP